MVSLGDEAGTVDAAAAVGAGGSRGIIIANEYSVLPGSANGEVGSLMRLYTHFDTMKSLHTHKTLDYTNNNPPIFSSLSMNIAHFVHSRFHNTWHPNIECNYIVQ